MNFIAAMNIDELWEGEMVGLTIAGRSILLIHLSDGVHAFENRCAHLAVALDRGKLEGRTLTCPAHGWQFEACSGRGLNPTTARLKIIPVRVENGKIYVDLTEVDQCKTA